MKTKITALALLLALLLCSCSVGQIKNNDKYTVVCMDFPSYDLARAVCGSEASVTLAIPSDADMHSWTLTLSETALIQTADLLIYIGGEGSEGVEKAVATSPKPPMVLKLIDKVELLPVEHDEDEEEHGEEEHEHGEYDTHVWTSPKNAAALCQAICDLLCTEDGDNAESYKQGCADYKLRLNELDGQFKNFFDSCEHKILIVGDVFPFRYFAHEYGLDYCAAFTGCAEGDVAPSLSRLALIAEKLRDTGLSAVYYVEFSSKLTAERIAAETGATPTLLHSGHRLERSRFNEGVTLADIMSENLETLKNTLH